MSHGTRFRLPGLALVVVALASPAPSAEPVATILPVDGAEFLPGGRFDFSVQWNAAEAPTDPKVTVNGVAAAEFFGRPAAETPRATGLSAWVWEQVGAPAPGDYRVEVKTERGTSRADWRVRAPRPGTARNVILLIADGMSVAELTAARLLSRGMTAGRYDRPLAIDGLEEIGLVHTSGLDSIISDSAATASAYNTGHKTSSGATGGYVNGSPDPLDDPRVETFAEMVIRTRGMGVGIVTTSEWNDATPAAVFGHCGDRLQSCRWRFVADPLDRELYPQVILGGGSQWMQPLHPQPRPELITEYEASGYSVVRNATELNAALAEPPARLLGLFHPSHMNVWLDRNVYRDNLGEYRDQPGLPEMTRAALRVLARNRQGFYLMVEAAHVDKQMHYLDHERALAELIEFDEAVAVAVDWAEEHAPETLIVVTSDHGHGFDVYGTVDVKAFNRARSAPGRLAAIRVYEKAGFPSYEDGDGDGYPDRWDVDVTIAGTSNNHPRYIETFQVSPSPPNPGLRLIPGRGGAGKPGLEMNDNLPPSPGPDSGVHTLQDVPVFAAGPGAKRFGKVMDNTEVFFAMAYAIGLDPSSSTGRVE